MQLCIKIHRKRYISIFNYIITKLGIRWCFSSTEMHYIYAHCTLMLRLTLRLCSYNLFWVRLCISMPNDSVSVYTTGDNMYEVNPFYFWPEIICFLNLTVSVITSHLYCFKLVLNCERWVIMVHVVNYQGIQLLVKHNICY